MKIRHLTKTAEFTDVLKTGRKIKGEEISIYAKLFPGQGDLSVGIIIPKKVVPLATKRNYIRRIIYGFFLNNGENELGKTEIVVKVKKVGKTLKRKEILDNINKEIISLLKRIRID